MDEQVRQLGRDLSDPMQQVRWLREKVRSGTVAEAIKRMLCALGYEPMVLAIGGPPKSGVSYMVPGSYCKYQGGQWLRKIDYMRVARYIAKKHWSRRLAEGILNQHPMQFQMQHQRDAAAMLAALELHDLMDGVRRLDLFQLANLRPPFYMTLALRLKDQEVRDDLISCLLSKLR